MRQDLFTLYTFSVSFVNYFPLFTFMMNSVMESLCHCFSFSMFLRFEFSPLFFSLCLSLTNSLAFFLFSSLSVFFTLSRYITCLYLVIGEITRVRERVFLWLMVVFYFRLLSSISIHHYSISFSCFCFISLISSFYLDSSVSCAHSLSLSISFIPLAHTHAHIHLPEIILWPKCKTFKSSSFLNGPWRS